MISDHPLTLGQRWWTFSRERFPLASHLAMAVLFSGANCLVAAKYCQVAIPPGRLALAMLLTLSFLFRLRCFDEIKDYTTDVSVNPDRPLPRGVLTLRQVKLMIVFLVALEVGLTAPFGWQVLASHLLAVGYSFLMYREFFVGKWLRPQLTLYAVTHTFCLMLLGWSLASYATGTVFYRLPVTLLLFGLANWMLFNIFEFARKSWAPEEEMAGVESYSSLYRPAGAALLTFSQAVIALGILWWQRAMLEPTVLFAELGAGAVLAFAVIRYAIRPSISCAKQFRLISAVFILVFYLLLIVGVWKGGA